MKLQLDLNKATAALTLSLEKRGIVIPPSVEVALDLDVSGSFEDEHLDGTTNDLMARLLPWAMVFDPDKKLDMFTFSRGAGAAHYVGDVNAQNYEDYVRRNVINKVPGWNGGTVYAPVIRKNLEHFGWLKPAEAVQGGGGFFSKMFGSKPAASTAIGVKKRSLALFITDGENDDTRETESLLEQMERDQMGMYVMFIGVSNQGVRFPFLEKMADRFKNTGLYVVKDLKRFVASSDDQVNEAIINDELIAWLK